MDIKKSTFFRSGRISVSQLVLSIKFIWHDKGGDNFPNLQHYSEKKLSQARKKFVGGDEKSYLCRKLTAMKDLWINIKYMLIYVVVPSVVTTLITMFLLSLVTG